MPRKHANDIYQLPSRKHNRKLISVADILGGRVEKDERYNPLDRLGTANSVISKVQEDYSNAISGKKLNSTLERLQLGFRSVKELHYFLKDYMDLTIPYKKNCHNHDHCSPFKFVTDVYLFGVLYALVVGPRGGGKTRNMGLLDWLGANQYAGYHSLIASGSEQQGMRMLEALEEYWDRAGSDSRDVLVGGSQFQGFVEWFSGSSINVLSSSSKSVRGPHEPNLKLDEVDEMDWKIYETSMSIPMTKGKFSASIIAGSTYHKMQGTMAKLLGDSDPSQNRNDDPEELEERINYLEGYKIYKYCIFEVLKSCKGHCAGTNCVMPDICPGQHMKQAVGYYDFNDFLQKRTKISKGTLDSEYLCKKPSRKGLVLEDYDENVNTVDIGWNPNLPVFLAIDFGFSVKHAYAILAIQELVNFPYNGRLLNGMLIFDELYTVPTVNQVMINATKQKPWAKYPQQIKGYADSAGKSFIREWQNAGFRILGVDKNKMTVEQAIERLNALIKPSLGQSAFFVNKTCRGFLMEKDKYRYPDIGKRKEPIKEFDHAIDAARYYVMMRENRKIKFL